MKEINKRLLRTPRPFADEGLKGLIVRATEQNGYEKITMLNSLIGVNNDYMTNNVNFTEQQWTNLSEVLSIDISTLKRMGNLHGIEKRQTKDFNIFGHMVNPYSIRINSPRVCPGCLRYSDYIRRIWDLAAFTCCPEHGNRLIEKCPNCGKRISWSRGRVSVCSCGQDWRDITLPQVTDTETILSRLILKVCGLPGTKDKAATKGISQDKKIPNPLGSVSLGELLSAVFFISGLKRGIVDVTGKQYVAKLSYDELHEELTKAVIVFENWPDNYFRFIDESKGLIPMGKRASGLYKDFGKLYDPLFIRKNNPLPDFMRDTFKQYITTRWDGGYAGWYASISQEELNKKKYMTRSEISKYLHISLITVNQLYKNGYIKGEYHPWVNRSRIMIEADSVRELKERWDKSITTIQAGEMLGIGRRSVVGLLKNGCITAIQGPTVTGQIEWKFEESEIKRLLDMVFAKIQQNSKKDNTRIVDFQTAIKKLTKLSINIGGFVKLILNDEIRPVAIKSKKGLASLYFDEKEIENLSRVGAIERRDNKHNLKETAKLMGTDVNQVMLLIKKGLLSAKKIGYKWGGKWIINRAEIEQFKNIYATTGEITRSLGVSKRGFADRLIAAGLVPVSGPKIDGGNIYLFKRSDLDAVDVSMILPVKERSVIYKMNARGLVSTKQLSDITGYSCNQIIYMVETGKIYPDNAILLHSGKGSIMFFSEEQVEKLKMLKYEQKSQMKLFDAYNKTMLNAA